MNRSAMLPIAGERLVLARMTVTVLERRLLTDRFTAPLQLADGEAEVAFRPSWPGDAWALFPAWLAQAMRHPSSLDANAIVVERATNTAVGAIGWKGGLDVDAVPRVDADGAVEVGYGMDEDRRGRGYAREALGLMVAASFSDPCVAMVRADTVPGNVASQRVLRACGFTEIGLREDPRDGPLVCFERRR